jgi:hypothetical protein
MVFPYNLIRSPIKFSPRKSAAGKEKDKENANKKEEAKETTKEV